MSRNVDLHTIESMKSTAQNLSNQEQLNLFSDALTVDQLDWAEIMSRPEIPKTSDEGLKKLIYQLQESLTYLNQENWVAGQLAAENALSTMLVTLKQMGMTPSLVLSRSCNRLQTPVKKPVGENNDGFYIYPDRVELHSEGEIRGEWPLYSQEDYDNFTRLAYELGYSIFHQDARQLELL